MTSSLQEKECQGHVCVTICLTCARASLVKQKGKIMSDTMHITTGGNKTQRQAVRRRVWAGKHGSENTNVLRATLTRTGNPVPTGFRVPQKSSTICKCWVVERCLNRCFMSPNFLPLVHINVRDQRHLSSSFHEVFIVEIIIIWISVTQGDGNMNNVKIKNITFNQRTEKERGSQTQTRRLLLFGSNCHTSAGGQRGWDAQILANSFKHE